ncbi:hypothetical protein ACWEO4_01155 [Streptomyces sp. NPDC004393]|uniref:hypothetical protein n=1 Tax=Streptomyces sp. NPDC004533 TaxID=3154278 RepID=UPI0033A8A632
MAAQLSWVEEQVRLITRAHDVPRRRKRGSEHKLQERFEAKRAGSHTVEIDSSHLAVIAHPEAVTDLVLQPPRRPIPPGLRWPPLGRVHR